MALEQLAVREREIVLAEDGMEADLVARPVQHINSEDGLQSSVKSGEPGSSLVHESRVCLCALRRFVHYAEFLLQSPSKYCSFHTSVPDSIQLVTSSFKQAAQMCLKMVDGFCEVHHSDTIELFVMRALNFTIANPVLINMEEFPKCLIWFFSWSKKWESALDFIRSYFQTVFRGDCESLLAKLHYQLGSVFIATAEKEKTTEKNAETLNFAADHMWESGRVYSARHNFELASKAYYEAVRAARLSKNLQKAGSILMEALEATLLWSGNEKLNLWESLQVLVGSYQCESKLLEAVDLLKRGLILTCNWKVTNEDRRKYLALAVGIESTVGDHALWSDGSHGRVLESTSKGDGPHHARTAPVENPGDAPYATSRNQSLEERTSLTEHGRISEEKCQVAKALFNFCSQLCPRFTDLKLKFNSAYAQYNSGAVEEALKAFEEALAAVTNDSERYDMRFLIDLLIKYSDLLEENGRRVKMLEVLKEAHRLFCNADFVNSTYFCDGATGILNGFLGAGDISSAVDFARHLDSGTSSSKHGSGCINTHFVRIRLCEAIDDKEGAADHLGAYCELLEGESNETPHELGDINDLFDRRAWNRNVLHRYNIREPEKLRRFNEVLHLLLGDRVLGATSEQGLANLIEVRTILQNELGNDPRLVGPISLKLAFSYSVHQKYRLAEEEREIATKCFEELDEHDPIRIHHIGLLYMCKAFHVGFDLGNCDEALDWINKARPYMQDIGICDGSIAILKMHQYGLNADICKEFINISVMEERQLPFAVDSLWIASVDKSIKFYRNMEWHALNNERSSEHRGLQALLWAERSRARLFMHISGEQAKAASHTSKLTDFDESDAYGANTIKSVLEECGSNVAVIEFSYFGDDKYSDGGNLFMYVTFVAGGQLKVYPFEINFVEELKATWNKNLEDFVNLVIDAIKSKEEGDKQAKEYLSYLHDVLRIGFIMTLGQQYFDTIVFVCQGYLSFLPLHALYDKFRDEFLIQRYRICYIPSIRILNHCLQLQKMRKASRNLNKVEPAFVAGNPHPMGRNMRPLPNAEEEAKEVAEILGVQPCVRENMTKVAVQEGLCRGSIVLLATHAQYPPGVIVVRGVDHSNDDSADDLIYTFEDDMITAKELSKLHVNAALVVLNCCESGKGEIRSEGVLGLGRSVLQAGASSVMLSLWEIDDQASRTLVTDMFRNAVNSPSSVSDSLGTSMLNMLHDTNICHWAPLIFVGSPTLFINDLISKDQKERVDANGSYSTNFQKLKQDFVKNDNGKEDQISSQTLNSIADDDTFLQRTHPVVHPDIMCDGCETVPITGPRFNARASYKFNYDLCLRCFTDSGCTLGQFNRIELPLTFLEHGTPLDPCSVGCLRESCIRGGKCQCIKAVAQKNRQMGCIARGLVNLDLS